MPWQAFWIFELNWGENKIRIYTSQDHAECQNMPHGQLSLTSNFYYSVFWQQRDKRGEQSLAVIDPFLMQTKS